MVGVVVWVLVLVGVIETGGVADGGADVVLGVGGGSGRMMVKVFGWVWVLVGVLRCRVWVLWFGLVVKVLG